MWRHKQNVAGVESEHNERNDNGERLLELVLENNMKIVSAAFDHRQR